MKKWSPGAAALGALLAATAPTTTFAQEIPPQVVDALRSWTQEPTVLITLRSWNKKHQDLTQADIDALDTKWRKQRETEEQPLIAEISGAPLSDFLIRKQAASGGRLIESFVMDSKGLNVGLSSVTSDYWQGDEAKFQETFGKGPDSVHFGEVEVKDSTGHRAQQVSLTITDPETGEAIGAVTAEFDLDVLAMYRAGS